jgi:N-acetylneuraminate synthase
VELVGLERLVRDVRDVESGLGDGIKVVYESEKGARDRLRRVAARPTLEEPAAIAS